MSQDEQQTLSGRARSLRHRAEVLEARLPRIGAFADAGPLLLELAHLVGDLADHVECSNDG